MDETLHTVGNQDYKVDHIEKKVYRKQVLTRSTSPAEKAAYPEGHKWIETAGDYDRFVARYSAAVNPAPQIEERPPAPPVINEPEGEAPETLSASPELLSARKLSRR